jgi:hypothetical protein
MNGRSATPKDARRRSLGAQARRASLPKSKTAQKADDTALPTAPSSIEEGEAVSESDSDEVAFRKRLEAFYRGKQGDSYI